MYKEVIMEYINANKYFDLGILTENNKITFIPKTKEIFPYIKNIISYSYESKIYGNVAFDNFDNFEEYQNDEKIIKFVTACFNHKECLTFEFATEEEAFYFKLKYC